MRQRIYGIPGSIGHGPFPPKVTSEGVAPLVVDIPQLGGAFSQVPPKCIRPSLRIRPAIPRLFLVVIIMIQFSMPLVFVEPLSQISSERRPRSLFDIFPSSMVCNLSPFHLTNRVPLPSHGPTA